jgi:hypothetical protein
VRTVDPSTTPSWGFAKGSNVTGPCKPYWTSHDLPDTRGPLSRSWWERGFQFSSVIFFVLQRSNTRQSVRRADLAQTVGLFATMRKFGITDCAHRIRPSLVMTKGPRSHYPLENGLTLKQAALKLGFVMEDEFDRIVDPAKMAHPEPLMPAEK